LEMRDLAMPSIFSRPLNYPWIGANGVILGGRSAP
jgi:hypothetical protein